MDRVLSDCTCRMHAERGGGGAPLSVGCGVVRFLLHSGEEETLMTLNCIFLAAAGLFTMREAQKPCCIADNAGAAFQQRATGLHIIAAVRRPR